MTIEGFEVRASRFDQDNTITRLLAALEERGLSVFARINHAAAASAVGLQLAPTELFLVGNPKAGTALMQAGQTAGIDLPLRLLVWTDADHQTRVGFDDPRWIVARHDIAAETNERTDMLARGLRAIAAAASGET